MSPPAPAKRVSAYRHLFTGRLLLCAATCVLWVRSYGGCGTFRNRRAGGPAGPSPTGLRTLGAYSSRGRILLPRADWPPDPAEVGGSYTRLRSEEPFDLGPDVMVGPMLTPAAWGRRYGFGIAGHDGRTVETGHMVLLPHAAVAAATAAVPAWWLCGHYRVSRRRRAGRCPACGCDLRATPGRCPECGAEPKTIPISN